MTSHDVRIRPVRPDDLDAVPSRCWPVDPAIRRHLADIQEILGFAAWFGETCVGQLHCYRLDLPDVDASVFPEWTQGENRKFWPLGWPLERAVDAAARGAFHPPGPLWGHACFHVGLLKDGQQPDSRYFGRGIGTTLAMASTRWALQHRYAGVLALGGPTGFFESLTWMGILPWTTYARMGFRMLAVEENGRRLPWWAAGGAAPDVVRRAREMVVRGRAPADLCFRAMLLEL